MTTYVLIPGACHGAWCFDDLADALRTRGHRVLAYTLTGISDRAHLAQAGVNLETHIADVLAALSVEKDAEDLVLVGHSYGGMVISGVADRVPERVDALVHLDALVQRITLTGDLSTIRRRDFVYALKWPGDSPLRSSYERVRDDPSWVVHELNGAHNLMRDNPEDLVRILLDAGAG